MTGEHFQTTPLIIIKRTMALRQTMKIKHALTVTAALFLLGYMAPSGSANAFDGNRSIRTRAFRGLSAPESGKRLMASSDALELRGGASDTTRFLYAIDLFGTGVFAFSGSLTAGRKGMDLLGMVLLAAVTSIGGGTFRDVMLGSTPVFWIRQPIYLQICVVVAIATYLLWPVVEKKFGWKDSSQVICIADALSMSAFAVIGTQKGSDMELNPFIWPATGLSTATAGGIVRDVICQEPPRSMYPHQTMYAIHPLFGSAVYTMLISKFGIQKDTAAIIAFVLICTTRMLSFKSPVRLPHWSEKQVQSSQ